MEFFLTPEPWLGVAGFIVALSVWRVVSNVFWSSLFAFVFAERVPVVVEEDAALPVLEQWWASMAKLHSAPRHEIGDRAAARVTMERTRRLRVAAQAAHYREQASGDAPRICWLGGWDSFWLQLTVEEQQSFMSLLFTAMWHVMTVTQALVPGAWMLSAQMTWAANVADLLLVATGRPNAHGARRVTQLAWHHAISAVGIPLLLALCELSPDNILLYQLCLEVTGLLSALLAALQFTPASETRANYVAHLLVFACFALLRGPLWALLGVNVALHCVHQRLWGSVALVVIVHGAMTWFNVFFLSAWWKRCIQSARACGCVFAQPAWMPRTVNAFTEIVLAWATSQWQSLCVMVWVVPPLFTHLSPAVAAAATVALAVVTYTPWRSSAHHRGASRVVLTRHSQVVEVLSNASFSPTPHRWTDPKPLMAPFASWVKGMLLYSLPGDHARLRHHYPPLNRPVFVREHLGDYVRQCVQSLLLPLRGRARFDFMAVVGHTLPWMIMQRIAGIPMADVPRAAELIRALGDFVGRPVTPQLLQDAMVAQRGLLELIGKWRAQQQQQRGAARRALHVADGALAFWEQHEVFATVPELEANVVMLLFAGTHNLENVLGHAVRLLLENADQLAALRANPEQLLSTVVDETLRVSPPIQLLPRTALVDVVLSWGQRFAKGETVLLDVLSANAECADPKRFDLARTDRKHVSFGMGAHICNGSALGRHETREVVRELLVQGVLGSGVELERATTDAAATYATLQELHLRVRGPVDVVRVSGLAPEHPFCRLCCSEAFCLDVRVDQPLGACDYFFAFVPYSPAPSAEQLLAQRNAVTRDCFKVVVVEGAPAPLPHKQRMEFFSLLKRARFNLVVAGGFFLTPECGAVPYEPSPDYAALLEFAMKRKNVRWFQTQRLPDAPPAMVDEAADVAALLRVAHGAHLFGGALDPTSGNVSLRWRDGLWVTPRQVVKGALRERDMCWVRSDTEQHGRSVACCVPSHLGPEVKSSIDTGMLLHLYDAWPTCAACVHFHHGGVVVRDCHATTGHAYPCGALEEALEVLAVTDQLQLPLMVELTHHGYLLVLDEGGPRRLLAQWTECMRRSRFPARDGWRQGPVEPHVVHDLPFPVFAAACVIGVTTVASDGHRWTWTEQ